MSFKLFLIQNSLIFNKFIEQFYGLQKIIGIKNTQLKQSPAAFKGKLLGELRGNPYLPNPIEPVYVCQQLNGLRPSNLPHHLYGRT